jgi:hypothetical protein
MSATVDEMVTTLATAYGGPLAGVIAGALLQVGKAELEKHTGRPLLSHTREEMLALLDQSEIGETADEVAEGEALAVKELAAEGTRGESA